MPVCPAPAVSPDAHALAHLPALKKLAESVGARIEVSCARYHVLIGTA